MERTHRKCQTCIRQEIKFVKINGFPPKTYAGRYLLESNLPIRNIAFSFGETVVKHISKFKALERLHTRAARIIYRLNWDLPSQEVIHKTGWKTLSSTYKQRVLSTVHKCCYGEAPDQLCQNIITKKDNNLRGSEKLVIPRPETNFLHKSVTFRGAVLWNKLPTNLKNEERHNNFKILILRQWILALTQTIMILTISIFKLF